MSTPRSKSATLAFWTGLVGWVILVVSPVFDYLFITLTGPPCIHCPFIQGPPWWEYWFFWLRTLVFNYGIGLGAAALGLILFISFIIPASTCGAGLLLLRLGRVKAGAAILLVGSVASLSLAQGFVVGPSLMLAASIVGLIT